MLEVPSGYMHVLAEDSPAGDVARRMLPAAMILPPIIGGVRLAGERAGLYDTNVGVTLHASALVGVFSVVAALSARAVRNLELGRREAEDARRKSEAWFATAFRASPVGMTITDSKSGTFIDLNPAAEALLGVSKAEAVGKTSLDLGVVSKAERSDRVSRVEKDGHLLDTEIPLTPKGGPPRTVIASIETLDYGGRLVLLTVMVDITQRKAAEDAVMKSREELAAKADELARSNSELEQFAYVASHDLQEPLRMVASYVQLIKRRYQGKLDGDADEFIQFAVEGSNRMQALINDLLTYSRVGTRGKPLVPVDAEAPLKRAIENLQLAIDESKTVIKFGAMPTVKADEMQLVQLFQNLLSNAIKYHGSAAPHIEVSAARDGAAWRFEVRDNGIGIDPKHFDRIFIIFQRLQARDETSGTGIGLALCKKIVERHGGRIWVESVPGKGSTFHFTIADMVKSGGTSL